MSGTAHIRTRHWIEYAATAAVLVISVISLWVAIGTEDANRRMVEASSWPFLQMQRNNLDQQDHPRIDFYVVNSGVGPAKIHSLELFWNGKRYSSALAYLHDCCGFDVAAYRAARASGHNYTPIILSDVRGNVLRAGEARSVLTVALGSDNALMWHALDEVRGQTSFRACYCSVFDECWESTLDNLNPKLVNECPVVTSNFPS